MQLLSDGATLLLKRKNSGSASVRVILITKAVCSNFILGCKLQLTGKRSYSQSTLGLGEINLKTGNRSL